MAGTHCVPGTVKAKAPKISRNTVKPKPDQTKGVKATSSRSGPHNGGVQIVRRASQTALDSVVSPEVFPALPAKALTNLTQGLQFVASGNPVPAEFLAELQRMLNNSRERGDLASVVIQHHAAHRYQKLAAAVDQTEAILFNPNQLLRLTPDQLLKAMALLYGEQHTLRKVIDPADPEPAPAAPPILQSADPQKVALREEAHQAVSGVPAAVRQRVRGALQKLLSQAIIQPAT